MLIIDMQDLAFGPNADILTAIKEHHTAAMGEIAWKALPIIKVPPPMSSFTDSLFG